eukprot:8541732-Pyramimonas_sp.AAC.1
MKSPQSPFVMPKTLSTRLISPSTCPLPPAVFTSSTRLDSMSTSSETPAPRAPEVSRLTSSRGPHLAGLALHSLGGA